MLEDFLKQIIQLNCCESYCGPDVTKPVSENNLATARRSLKAEAELRKSNNDLRARERERDAAEARASAAQAESDRGATNSNVLAAAKRVSLHTIKKMLQTHKAVKA